MDRREQAGRQGEELTRRLRRRHGAARRDQRASLLGRAAASDAVRLPLHPLRGMDGASSRHAASAAAIRGRTSETITEMRHAPHPRRRRCASPPRPSSPRHADRRPASPTPKRGRRRHLQGRPAPHPGRLGRSTTWASPILTGMFGAATGTLTIDPAKPAATKVDVTFPIAERRTHRRRRSTKHLQVARLLRRRQISRPRASSRPASSPTGDNGDDHRQSDAQGRDQAGHARGDASSARAPTR